MDEVFADLADHLKGDGAPLLLHAAVDGIGDLL